MHLRHFLLHPLRPHILHTEAHPHSLHRRIDERTCHACRPVRRTREILHDEIIRHARRQLIIRRLPVVIRLVCELRRLHHRQRPRQVRVRRQFPVQPLQLLQVRQPHRLVWLPEIHRDFQRHQPVEILLEESQVLPYRVRFFQIVHHIPRALHERDAQDARRHQHARDVIHRMPPPRHHIHQTLQHPLDERIAQMPRLLLLRHRQETENRRNQHQTNHEHARDAQKRHPSEIHQYPARRDRERCKPRRRRQVRQQRRVPHLLHHPLQSLDFVPVAHILRVILVNHIHTVRYPDHNQQRRQHRRQQRDFHPQHRHNPQRPHHAHPDNPHAEPHNPQRPEEKIQDNRRNQQRQSDKHIHFPLDVLRVDHPDVRHPRIMHLHFMLRAEPLRDAQDVLHQLHPLRRPHHLRRHRHHHPVCVPLPVHQRPLIKRQPLRHARQAVRLLLRPHPRREHRAHLEPPLLRILPQVERMRDVHQRRHSLQRPDAVPHRPPVVHLLQTEKLRIPNREHHHVPLLPEHLPEA